MRFSGIFLSLVIIAVAALWYVPAMIWGYQITQEAERFSNGSENNMAELMEGPAPVRWWRNQKRLFEYYTMDELTPRRAISLEIIMPFEGILAPGEERPDEVYEELYAQARAPAILMGYCPEFLGDLAVKCGVGSSEGNVRTGHGQNGSSVSIEGRLEYIPAYGIGSPETVENGEVVVVSASLIEGGNEPNTAESRQTATASALSICDKLRQKFGNCVISSLSLSSRVSNDVDTLRALARFAVYADKTQYREDTVQLELNRIVDQALN